MGVQLYCGRCATGYSPSAGAEKRRLEALRSSGQAGATTPLPSETDERWIDDESTAAWKRPMKRDFDCTTGRVMQRLGPMHKSHWRTWRKKRGSFRRRSFSGLGQSADCCSRRAGPRRTRWRGSLPPREPSTRHCWKRWSSSMRIAQDLRRPPKRWRVAWLICRWI